MRVYFDVGDSYDVPWYLSDSYVLFFILRKRNGGECLRLEKYSVSREAIHF